MELITGLFDENNARLMASVVAFVAFFLIARIVRARQPVALAFGLTPLLMFSAVHTAAASGLI